MFKHNYDERYPSKPISCMSHEANYAFVPVCFSSGLGQCCPYPATQRRGVQCIHPRRCGEGAHGDGEWRQPREEPHCSHQWGTCVSGSRVKAIDCRTGFDWIVRHCISGFNACSKQILVVKTSSALIFF